MIHARSDDRRGFTLIEAIAAIVVLSVAVPAMLMAGRSAQGGRASMVLANRARWLAAERLEEIIADRHSATRGFAYITGSSYPDEVGVSGFESFSREVDISRTAADLATPGDTHALVTVTVSWIDGSGGARELALTTVLTDYTP